MSKLRLEYEILVSGIYPFKGHFEKNGFKIVEKVINDQIVKHLSRESVIYLSPFIGMCCYSNNDNDTVYLTFQKEEEIQIDYGEKKEYDVEFTNSYIEDLNLFEKVNMLEKTLVLEVNNDIKFPIKMVKVYNLDGELVTILGDFMKLNVPCLLSEDQEKVFEVMKRQNNRLNSGISYEKVAELAQNNKFFKNALSMYHASFSVSDHNVGFTLLVISLESLLGLSTYSKPERCECCNQIKFAITSTISQNVSTILMDQDGVIENRMKKLYRVRSKFVHEGIEIKKQEEQEMQEYVRKVLLMYWFVSMHQTTYNHKDIIKEIQSAEYKENLMYQSFLTKLDNTSFDEKRTKMLKDIFLKILENSKVTKDE